MTTVSGSEFFQMSEKLYKLDVRSQQHIPRFYNAPDFKAYGYLEIRLFPIFNFFSGIKIVDEKFNAPHKVLIVILSV